jgi:hypothetical protein
MRRQEEREIARATQILTNETAALSDNIGGSNPHLFPIPVVIPAQAANALLNGDYSHSVSTWNDAVNSGGNRNEECAWWFSNDAPALGQVLDTTITP